MQVAELCIAIGKLAEKSKDDETGESKESIDFQFLLAILVGYYANQLGTPPMPSAVEGLKAAQMVAEILRRDAKTE